MNKQRTKQRRTLKIIQFVEEVVHVWGRYLEWVHPKINLIFLPRIPESFLPFPKEILLECLSIMANHYSKTGNQRRVELMLETAPYLHLYVDDEEALLQAAKHFNDPEWRKAILPAFKSFQEEW
jgi:hypothetical protein